MNVNYKKMLVKKSKKNIYTGGTPGVNNNVWSVVKSKKESKKKRIMDWFLDKLCQDLILDWFLENL